MRGRSREYNWTGLSQQRTLLDKAARTAAQFTPHSWDERDWRVFSSPARCLQCLVPIAVVLTMEVCARTLRLGESTVAGACAPPAVPGCRCGGVTRHAHKAPLSCRLATVPQAAASGA